jgi:fermentation-respiration switch protein FrsA (DUF1100 family)
VTDAALLRELSPLHRADRITAPLLVVHGANDTNVPLGEAEQIVAALRARGRAPRLLVFPGEGHEVRGVTNRAVFVDEVVAWVRGPLTGVSARAERRDDLPVTLGADLERVGLHRLRAVGCARRRCRP